MKLTGVDMTHVAEYAKAVAGALTAGAAAVTAALLDGHIDGGEWLTIAGAVAGAFTLVFGTKNAPAPPHPG